jgi:hypothetical protein
VGLEADRDAVRSVFVGTLPQSGEQSTMAAMDAVEVADRDDAPREGGFDVGKWIDLHGEFLTWTIPQSPFIIWAGS